MAQDETMKPHLPQISWWGYQTFPEPDPDADKVTLNYRGTYLTTNVISNKCTHNYVSTNAQMKMQSH